MKKTTTSIIVALALCACASAQAGTETDSRVEKAQAHYRTGMAAINQGDFDLAKTSFDNVLKLYPNHPQAREKLIYISSNRKKLEIEQDKATLRGVILPQVDLERATLQEALDMLTVQVVRESKKKVNPNFVVQDPSDGFKGRTITLRLSRIPAETLLRYIMDQAGGKLRYDKHAIVVRPRYKAAAVPAPASDDDLFAE